ncbi:MAG: heavy metal translocating P-type ATPase [Acidobacteriota bacterium]|nr:heavy metal translocating P-type ATPase [Acidobacteriota bacterium]
MIFCFHCGLVVAEGERWRAEVLGEERDFCCAGCRAVAEAISEGGLDAYYRMRTENAPRASPDDTGARPDERLFDREDVQSSFVREVGGLREASLLLEGVRCPACLWLNEQRLRSLAGVVETSASYPSHGVRVRWDPSRIALSAILAAVRGIGYRALPFDPSHRASAERNAARRDAPRLVFAGAVGMMVMNLALASYVLGGPGADGALPLWETFGRWVQLAASAALLAYPGQDFFAGGFRDLRQKRAGMDVPIALGMLVAWAGGAWATFRGSGPVFFDAIAMLVFFVLLARAFETRARLSAAAIFDRFAVVQPGAARRIGPDGLESEVAALDLRPGDVIRARPDETVPADGILLEGSSSFDEAVLTGEPWPRPREAGEDVVAGSRNCGPAVLIRVTRTGESSTIGEIRRLLEKGLESRPRFAELADSLAGWLVALVLVLSAATAAFWLVRDPSMALPATVAVLIVTCPCALALATPVVLAVAAGRLAKIGILPARMAAIGRLARADTVAFDKTGTLTLATPRLANVHLFGGLTVEEAVAIAAALEDVSPHPIARALRKEAGPAQPADDVTHDAGEGMTGSVHGRRWWIGTPGFASGDGELASELLGALRSERVRGRLVAVLSDRQGRGALLAFEEELRPGAKEIVGDLHGAGLRRAVLLSGDAREPVERLARALGFDEALGDLSASAKLAWIRGQKNSGAGVLFVGDGLNDAPTLAAVGVSASFAEAPQLSRLAADFLILGTRLAPIAAARRIAVRCQRLLVQNIGWALAYNVLAVPLAAAGLVRPWAAALGMSVSSLIVVGNAMRLMRPARGERLEERHEAFGAPEVSVKTMQPVPDLVR